MNIVIVNVVIIGNNLTDIIDYLGIFLLNVYSLIPLNLRNNYHNLILQLSFTNLIRINGSKFCNFEVLIYNKK